MRQLNGSPRKKGATEALYNACRRLIIDTDATTTGSGNDAVQSFTNTTWLAPPNKIDDIKTVSKGDKPEANPKTPKTKPKGATPSCKGSSWNAPVRNSWRLLIVCLFCM